MPEETEVIDQFEATPEVTPQAGEPTLTERLMADFDKPTDPKEGKEPTKPTAKPEAKKPEEKVAPKPGEKKVEAKPETGKVQPKLYEAHEALKKSMKELETKHQQMAQEYEASKAKAASVIDPKEIEAMKQERERLAAELREVAYERSDDYKRDYVQRGQALYDEALAEVKQLSVRHEDAETGEVTERPATEEDFRHIYFLPPRDQDKALHEMFGPSATRVAAYLNDIRRVNRDAKLAIQKHREDATQRTTQAQQKQQEEIKAYEELKGQAVVDLETKWPEWFKVPVEEGEGADPELAKAHRVGYDLVDNFVKNGNKLPIEDQAATSAVIRARAAAFPRFVVQMRRMEKELKELRDRVKTKERSDPGAGKGQGGGAPASGDDRPKSIDAAVSVFDSAAT